MRLSPLHECCLSQDVSGRCGCSPGLKGGGYGGGLTGSLQGSTAPLRQAVGLHGFSMPWKGEPGMGSTEPSGQVEKWKTLPLLLAEEGELHSSPFKH